MKSPVHLCLALEVGLISLTRDLVCRGCLKRPWSGAASRLPIINVLGNELPWQYKGRLTQAFFIASPG